MAAAFRVITITGPRQSGKTTLARATFPRKPYVNPEAADERAFATQDPRGFLGRFPDGAVIDEAQWVRELFSYQTLVDEDQRPGRFVLTGSQNFGLLSKITQSLAGRAGILHLLPLSMSELTNGGVRPKTIDEWLVRGFHPALHDATIPAHGWHAAYVTTYIERDARGLFPIEIKSGRTFQSDFVRALGLFARYAGAKAYGSGLVYGGDESYVRQGVTVRSWRDL